MSSSSTGRPVLQDNALWGPVPMYMHAQAPQAAEVTFTDNIISSDLVFRRQFSRESSKELGMYFLEILSPGTPSVRQCFSVSPAGNGRFPRLSVVIADRWRRREKGFTSLTLRGDQCLLQAFWTFLILADSSFRQQVYKQTVPSLHYPARINQITCRARSCWPLRTCDKPKAVACEITGFPAGPSISSYVSALAKILGILQH